MIECNLTYNQIFSLVCDGAEIKYDVITAVKHPDKAIPVVITKLPSSYTFIK